MNFLMKWTLFFAVLMLVMKPGHSFAMTQQDNSESLSLCDHQAG